MCSFLFVTNVLNNNGSQVTYETYQAICSSLDVNGLASTEQQRQETCRAEQSSATIIARLRHLVLQ